MIAEEENITAKLQRGIETLQNAKLTETDLTYLDIIQHFNGKPGPIWKEIFHDAFGDQKTMKNRYAVLNNLEKDGFIYTVRHPDKSIIEYRFHPDLLTLLIKKYPLFFSAD